VYVSDSAGLATHTGPASGAVPGNGGSAALTGERAGRVESPDIGLRVGCRRTPNTRQAPPQAPLRRGAGGPGGVGAPWQARRPRVRDPGGLAPALAEPGPPGEPSRGTAVRHGWRASARSIVPTRRPHTGGVEPRHTRRRAGRERATGKPVEPPRGRLQRRSALHQALDRLRAAVRRERTTPLTARGPQV
jgi:hypothetical protein